MLETKKLCEQNMTVSVPVSDFQGIMSNSSQIPNALTNGMKLTLIMEPMRMRQNLGSWGSVIFFNYIYIYIRACITHILILKKNNQKGIPSFSHV